MRDAEAKIEAMRTEMATSIANHEAELKVLRKDKAESEAQVQKLQKDKAAAARDAAEQKAKATAAAAAAVDERWRMAELRGGAKSKSP